MYELQLLYYSYSIIITENRIKKEIATAHFTPMNDGRSLFELVLKGYLANIRLHFIRKYLWALEVDTEEKVVDLIKLSFQSLFIKDPLDCIVVQKRLTWKFTIGENDIVNRWLIRDYSKFANRIFVNYDNTSQIEFDIRLSNEEVIQKLLPV